MYGFSGHVARAREIEVTAYNEHGELKTWRAKNWTARVIQHEYDHLQGVLYVDKMDTKTFTNDDERVKHPPSEIDIRNDGAHRS